jgi:hypothetical protein
MNVIIPLTMIEDYLLGCNVPENEKTEWADGGFYSLGTTNRKWQAICRSSSDTLWACVYGGDIYYSTDSGVTWTAYGAGSKDWNGITARGTNIYASVYNGSIWKLTDETGSFTDLAQTTRNWAGMCVCTDNHVWALADLKLYKQTDGAGDFAEDVTVAALRTCRHVCCSTNGNMYVSAHYNYTYYIYYRAGNSGAFSDLGTTVWPSTRISHGLCSDSSGNIYCATDNGDIYVRTAGAGNFNALSQTARAHRGMCADGNDSIYACVYAGSLYKADGFQTYNTGDYCQVTTGELSEHKIYQSNTDSNTGNDPTTDAVNWTLIGNTNRTKIFDDQIWDQSSASESIIWVFAPGIVQALAILNHESSTINIIEIDNDSNLVLNGLAFTGATGTTEPDDWDKVGTPSDYTIDSGAIKITADGNGEGMSQTMTVTAADEYQLLFLYKNTSGDVAQVGVYDVTHSADILATTDLSSSTEYCPYSYVFTVPAGCTSIKVSLTCKTSGDICWFDYVKLAPTIYNETITTGALVTYSVKTDLVNEANCILTVKVNNSGSTARCGEIVMGTKYDIGGRAPNFGLSWGIKDWSTIEPDTYGHYSIVEREQSKWMKGSIEIEHTDFDYVSNLLTAYTTEYMMWIGSETNQCQMIFGICDDWSFQQDEYSNAVLNFSIAGVT